LVIGSTRPDISQMNPAIEILRQMKDTGLTSVTYMKIFSRLASVIAMLFCVFFPAAGDLHAAPQDSIVNGIDRPPASREVEDPYAALEASYRQALETERDKLEYLAERVEQSMARAPELGEIHASHQVMISNHANLLAAADVDLQVLSRANARQQVELARIRERLAGFSDAMREFETLEDETDRQLSFYSRQIEYTKAQPPYIPVNRSLLDPLESLMVVLEQKKEKVETLIEHFTHWKDRFSELQNDIEGLSARYEQTIRERERERIVAQDANPVVRIVTGELSEDLARFSSQFREILTTRFWYKPEDISWETYFTFFGTFVVFFLAVHIGLYLLSRYLGILKLEMYEQDYIYRYLVLQLVQRSLVIMGAIAFLYFYPIRPVYQLAPFFVLLPILVPILVLLLGVQWGLLFLRGMRRYTEDRLFLRMIPVVRSLLVGIFVFGTVYILISRLYCADCILLTSWRLLGQISLFAWTIHFLRVFYRNAFGSLLAEHAWFENARPCVIIIGIGVVLTGLIAELAGFGGVSVFWFSGLWWTLLIALWAFILFGFFKESDVTTYIEKSDELTGDEFEEQPYPVRWLLVRVMRGVLVVLMLFLIPLAWGADRGFWADVFSAANVRVGIGDFEFSTMGVLYAAVVLLIIYTLSVIWKSVLRNRILSESDMEEGLKDSITRISVYGLWGVGLLVAMQMLGISGTSLAVVFGALGIGLGFGLQHIFRDFVSGIILLFERPIQVGDVVEIDGIWGTVKEINVRATYVKTFDNSDLIIPNADFVSRTVTNWSFRDPRVRRRIRVRVAYDTDVRLVKETLVNIAYRHPRVLRRPYPEVYFMELGESAMLFELRIWLHIDYFITVETEVRDDISRQFRDLGIRIAFPQQDIYIKESPSSISAVRDDVPVEGETPAGGGG